MKRIVLALVLLLEIAIAALFAMFIGYGRFDQNVFVLIYLLGIAAVLAAAAAWVLPSKWLAKAAIHGALLDGCIIFSIPFLWLLTTSFKYTEEIFKFPPHWIPAFPSQVAHSPYVTGEEFDPVEKPEMLAPERWEVLGPQMERALWEKGATLLKSRLEDFGLAAGDAAKMDSPQLRDALVRAAWDQIATGIPREAWSQPDPEIVRAAEGRLDADRMEELWPRISRSVALREITVQDDSLVDHKIGAVPLESLWQPLTRNVRLFRSNEPVHAGEGGAPLVVEYDLSREKDAVIRAEFSLPYATSATVATESLFSLTLPMRQDRSWHTVYLAVEMDGRRYRPEDGLNLGYHRWQELTLKFADKDNRDERNVGIYRLLEDGKSPSDFADPGKVRLTLAIRKAPYPLAVWRKFTANYRGAYISMPNRWHYLINSIYLVFLTVLGHVFSCSLVAYAFARLRWPGRNILFGILLASMMLPGQVTMIPVFLIYKHIGWYNTLKTLWVPSFLGGAFFIFLLRQFMKTIPAELEEAAKIDGCSYFGIYWRIMLPLLKPALAAVAIFTFMNTWNDFMGPLIYLNDQRLYPLALGLFDLRTEQGAEFGTLMAASTLMTLPVVALFFLAQRFFIQGITLTGMKG